ncbi:hypothetical protein [Smaragdicoccus niigatensis]|uniref:hypothetical protein n=1 Tax=Smaragdicoccus niigatensis TaxID=359359 RepID=UPI0003775292|nr:hypothetical protein [Smaragdicoccus niigatensis]
MTNSGTAELIAALHNRVQKAQSEARAIEDPSTRRAIDELAQAVREIAKHLKSASSPSNG